MQAHIPGNFHGRNRKLPLKQIEHVKDWAGPMPYGLNHHVCLPSDIIMVILLDYRLGSIFLLMSYCTCDNTCPGCS